MSLEQPEIKAIWMVMKRPRGPQPGNTPANDGDSPRRCPRPVGCHGEPLLRGDGVPAIGPLVSQDSVANFVQDNPAMHPVLSKQGLAPQAESLQEPG